MSLVEFDDVEHGRRWTLRWDGSRGSYTALSEALDEAGRAEDFGDMVLAVGFASPGECRSVEDLAERLREGYDVTVPADALAALRRPPLVETPRPVEGAWVAEAGASPWRVGTMSERWAGYLDPDHLDPWTGQPVLRNHVGATTFEELRKREDTRVGIRLLELEELDIPATFDLAGLQAIHRHVFQDVYPWAGEVRTVDMAKGSGMFTAHGDIEAALAGVAELVRETDRLRSVPEGEFSGYLARVYNELNMAHLFREGNGRTQRAFLSALAGESGRFIDWVKVPGLINDVVPEQARQGDLRMMVEMFDEIVTRRPAAESGAVARLPGALAAAYPRPAVDALSSTRAEGVGRPCPPSAGPGRVPGVERQLLSLWGAQCSPVPSPGPPCS